MPLCFIKFNNNYKTGMSTSCAFKSINNNKAKGSPLSWHEVWYVQDVFPTSFYYSF